MKLPSLMESGGLSTIAISISLVKLTKSGNSLANLFARSLSNFFNNSETLGIHSSERLRLIKSFALALPNETLPTILSKSYTFFKLSINSCLTIKSLLKASISV